MPSPVNFNKGPVVVVVEDLMHVEKLESCLQAKGKEVGEANMKVGGKNGDDNASLNDGHELRITSNSNYILAELANNSPKDGVVILDSKQRRMVDLQEKEDDNTLRIESSIVLLNRDKPKKWMWRALVSKPAKINEYIKLELSWFGQPMVSSGTSGPGVHKKA